MTCKQVLDLAAFLPVFPAVAGEVIRLLADSDLSFGEVESVTASDPVLAGNLLKVANSSYFSPAQEIRSIARAIAYIGLDRTRCVLATIVLRPLLARSVDAKIWAHSLDAARTASDIATQTMSANPAEAFLAGLVHDIGKLFIDIIPWEVRTLIGLLSKQGCAPNLAEFVTCGCDHAEAGSEVLRTWSFPVDYIEAVKYHHQPESSSSKLASILYVTEFHLCSEEDLPSHARLHFALRTLGMSAEEAIIGKFQGERFLETL